MQLKWVFLWATQDVHVTAELFPIESHKMSGRYSDTAVAHEVLLMLHFSARLSKICKRNSTDFISSMHTTRCQAQNDALTGTISIYVDNHVHSKPLRQTDRQTDSIGTSRD